ncbi:MAG: hypothetical protein CFE44_12865 [Burkholderiales bacterium PBB4]|nr:MAG: hypothetical protein CFE44_12865 [Burkholderiales bacterium PBB4]
MRGDSRLSARQAHARCGCDSVVGPARGDRSVSSVAHRAIAVVGGLSCTARQLLIGVLWCAWLLGAPTQAATPTQPVVAVTADATSISLNAQAWVYRDLGREQTLEAMAGTEGDALFRPGTLDVGQQQSHFWVRLKLHNQASRDAVWWLDSGNHYLPEIVVYAPEQGGQLQAQSAGGARPFADRPLPTPNFVYSITLPAGRTIDVLMRASTRGILSHNLDLRLWQPEVHRAHNRQVEVQWFLFLGLAAGLALFNLLLYFSLRDGNYLLYVATVLAQVWRTSDNGLAFEHFWPDAPFFEQVVSRGLSLIAVLVCTNLFVCRFIELHRLNPVLYRRLMLATLGISLMILLSMSGIYTSGFIPLSGFRLVQQLFVIATVLYVLFMLVLLLQWTWQGSRRARAILIAFAPVLVLTGVVVPLLTLLQIDFAWTIPPMMIGAAVELVLMSLALADRLNEATIAKEQAQHALVDGLQRKERELELRVEQRTQDLAHANEAFQGILENAQDAIVLTHHRGQITHWNQQAEITFGCSREHALGRDIASMIFPGGVVPVSVTQLLERMQASSRQETSRLETMAVRQDGSEFPIELSATAIHVNDQLEFGFFLRDITQRRRAEDEIRASLARQKELVDLKSRFVAMASHEFRTPLTTILSSTELLRFYGERMPSQERDALHISVESSVQRMTRMLDDVLLIGKSDAGMLECQPEPMEVGAFCQSLVQEVNDAAGPEPRTAQVALQVADAVGMAPLDPKLLRHILSNLLSNAIKYSPDGGVVEFEVQRQTSQLVFSVVDHGVGIPADEVGQLFESFFRASNVQAIEGTGLGLSSQLGLGSRFVVTLPVPG